MVSYLPLLLLFVVAAVIAAALFTLATVIGPKNPTPEKMIPFECGSESTGSRFVRPSVKFYLTAILFVVFGLVRPRTECTGGGCGACAGACHRQDPAGDHVS